MRWRNQVKIGKLTQVDSTEIEAGKEPCSRVQMQILILQGFEMLPRSRYLTNLRDENSWVALLESLIFPKVWGSG